MSGTQTIHEIRFQFHNPFHFYTCKGSLPSANEVWGKVMFLQVSVILLTGGVCLSACWDTNTPPAPGADNPPKQTPPLEQTPPGKHPPRSTPPRKHTPPFFLNFISNYFSNYFLIFDQLFYNSFICSIQLLQPSPPTPPPPHHPPAPMVNERAVRILLERILVDIAAKAKATSLSDLRIILSRDRDQRKKVFAQRKFTLIEEGCACRV